MTKIIIDSTTDLPDDIIKKYDISMLPLRVALNSNNYIDKVNIEIEEVYDAMRAGVRPITSLPNPKEIYELFESYARDGIDFIFYCFSSKLSSTYEVSHLIIEELKKKYPHVKMEILDTKSGCLATGLIVLQGAKLLEAGLSYEEVIEISYENINNIEHLFTIADLNWLLEGGRINKAEAIVGNILNIRPILDVQNGNMHVINKVRGEKRLFKTVMDIMYERISAFPDQIIGLAHTGDEATVFKVRDTIVKELGCKNIIVEKIGSVLASHLGMGGTGIFYLNKKPSKYINEI